MAGHAWYRVKDISGHGDGTVGLVAGIMEAGERLDDGFQLIRDREILFFFNLGFLAGARLVFAIRLARGFF